MAADLLLPLLFCGILCWGAVQGVDVFAAFRTGAARGLTAAREILPSLIALVTAVAMLRASGALELLCSVFAPAAEQLGLPGELLPMALLRPVSGSGALALFEDILTRFGPDSFIGAHRQRTHGLHRNHLLHYRPVLRRHKGAQYPALSACGPAGRPGGDLSECRRRGTVPGAVRPICKTAGFVIK